MAWHDITAFRWHTRSDFVGCCMTSPPFDNTHGGMTSGMACHHRHWMENAIEQRWAWYTSSPLGSTNGRRTSCMACHNSLWAAQMVEQHHVLHDIIALGLHERSNDVGRDMPSPPLDSTLGRTTFGVACHHCGWAAHTIERPRAWHDITSLGMHAWSDDVGRGITSLPLESTHGRSTSGVP